jgi:hypothetical protein
MVGFYYEKFLNRKNCFCGSCVSRLVRKFRLLEKVGGTYITKVVLSNKPRGGALLTLL